MGDSFIWGLKNGDLDAVTKHVEDKGDAVVNTETDGGRRPMHYAADYGQEEIIRYLISKGADINATDRHGITPLLAAIWEGHKSCVSLLLREGAKKDGKAPDGSSYLEATDNTEIKALLK